MSASRQIEVDRDQSKRLLCLSPVDSSDIYEFEALLGGHAESLEKGIPRPARKESIASWIERARRRWARQSEEAYCVRDFRLRLAGVVALTIHPGPPRHGQVSYWIAPPFRRRGFAKAATGELLRQRAPELDLDAVVAHVRPTNTASVAVLRRLGFHRNECPLPGLHLYFCPVFGFNDADAASMGDKVFILHSDQMDFLRRRAAAPLVEQLTVEVRQRYPDKTQTLNDAALQERIFATVRRAHGYGIEENGAVRHFTLLSFCVGPYFDRFPRFHAIFTNPKLLPNQKLGLVLETAGQIEWEAAARQPTPEAVVS